MRDGAWEGSSTQAAYDLKEIDMRINQRALFHHLYCSLQKYICAARHKMRSKCYREQGQRSVDSDHGDQCGLNFGADMACEVYSGSGKPVVYVLKILAGVDNVL
jgi:hypothetical protein